MNIQEKIDSYWSKRADKFSECRIKDLEGYQREIWTEIISGAFENCNGLRALDVGTGAGFYAFLLADLGFNVTAVDYCNNMIENAKNNSKELGYCNINFMQMDAQDLKFGDNSFDFIISRNVTWTLPDAKKAYEEWCRVLSPGGRIMNFDANYAQGFKFAEERGEDYKEMQNWVPSSYTRVMQSEDLIRERNDFAKQLYISNCIRPQWDVDILLQNGISNITIDTEISSKVYMDLDNKGKDGCKKFGSDSNMFMVYAIKGY